MIQYNCFRSLLQNFQNLSRQEQADMIAYMRRLEVDKLGKP